MNLNHSYIGPDELIYNNDGEIHSGGFSVNSIMLKNGLSPIMTLNSNNANQNANSLQIGGEKVSDLFNNLVIPNWTLSYNYKNGAVYEGGANGLKKHDKPDEPDEDDVMEENLHEKLLNLVKVDKTEMNNNNNKKISNKKTTKKHFNIGKKSKSKKIRTR